MAVVFASIFALVLGLAPAAQAQSETTRIGNFDFTVTLNNGQSDLRPGGHVRFDLVGRNHQSGFPFTPSVLNTYGLVMPNGFTGRAGGGSDMGSVGNHGQGNNYWGGQPSVTNRSVGRGSTRSGWLSFNIPENAMGGSRHNFGVRVNLETFQNWQPTQNNVIGFNLPAVGTSMGPISVSPSVARVGEEVTLETRVSANHGSNTPTGRVQFEVDGQSLSAPVQNGVARTTTTFDTTGSKSVQANFTPTTSSRWGTSSRTGTVNVQTETTQTNLTLDPVTVTAGGSLVARASVNPADADGEIEFSVAGESESVQVVDGEATAQFDLGEAGEYPVVATFVPANAARYSESSDTQTATVESETTETSLTVDPAVAMVGDDVTLSAAVAPAEASGTVTFEVNGDSIDAVVENGVATTARSFDEAGDYPVRAVFTPDNPSRYAASEATGNARVGTQATQTDLTLDQVEMTAGGLLTASAQVTPADAAGDIVFEVDGQEERVAVENGAASTEFQLDAAGEYTVTARFEPENPQQYEASSDERTVSVDAEATETSLDIAPTVGRVGEDITLTATVDPAEAEGTVAFEVEGQTHDVEVADGVATTTVQFERIGSYQVDATFTPDNGERYAESTTRSAVTIESEATQTDLTLDQVEMTAGGLLTASAQVTPADAAGDIVFEVGGEEERVAVENGAAAAEFQLDAAGEYTVTARFEPADLQQYEGSSDEQTVSVDAEATETSLDIAPTVGRVGEDITLTAVVAPAEADGVVTFDVDGDSISADVVDGIATATRQFDTVGDFPVSATFVPTDEGRYSGSTAAATVSIEAEATQTELTLDRVTMTAGGLLTASAQVTPSEAEGEIEFTVDGDTRSVPVDSGEATAEFQMDAAGEYTVTATFVPADSQRYTSSTDSEAVSVDAEATEMSLATAPSVARVGDEVTLTATVDPAEADGTVTFEVEGQTLTADVVDGVATATQQFDATGEFPVLATFAPTDSGRYSSTSAEATVTVASESTETDLTLDSVEMTAGGLLTASAQVNPADAEGDVVFQVAGQEQRVPLAEGAAAAEFQLDAEGEYTVTATFVPTDPQRYDESSDQQSVSVDTEATVTALEVSPTVGRAGADVTLTATVDPSEADGAVTFEVEGETLTADVVDGAATTTQQFDTTGEYVVTATFEPTDSDRYSSSSAEATVSIQAEATQTDLTLNSAELTPGGTLNATALVAPADAIGEVVFEVAGQEQRVPLAEGSATAEFQLDAEGTYEVTATFVPADDQQFAESSDNAMVAVDRVTTSIDVEPVEAEPGEPTRIVAMVSPADATGVVEFLIDGVPHEVTVVDGRAELEHTFATAGRVDVEARFVPEDSDTYGEASETVTVTVGDDDEDPADEDPTDDDPTGSIDLGSAAVGTLMLGSLGSLGSLGAPGSLGS